MLARTVTFGRKASSAIRTMLALQDKLASAIAREINVQLSPSEKARLTNAPRCPAAHDAYLKGRYFFNRQATKI